METCATPASAVTAPCMASLKGTSRGRIKEAERTRCVAGSSAGIAYLGMVTFDPAAAANGRGLGVVDAARYLFALEDKTVPNAPSPTEDDD